jgi:hypothetical protein
MTSSSIGRFAENAGQVRGKAWGGGGVVGGNPDSNANPDPKLIAGRIRNAGT